MKDLLLSICIALLYCSKAAAQTNPVHAGEIILFLGKDSVNIFLNKDYYLIEDSCAEIIRLAHFNQITKKFVGSFKDINSGNRQQLIAKGSYDENGRKEGNFICYYLNGNVQARGNFKNNLFHGKWDLFYPDGKPKITFVANGGDIKVLHTWNEEGKKIVDNGHGPYESLIGPVAWKGLLVGGQPDGKWTAERTLVRRSEVLASERFKLGEFRGGSNASGNYEDSSRIQLVHMDWLPIIRAEKMLLSNELCNVAKKKDTIYAWYDKGAQQFAEEIRDRLDPVINQLNLSPYHEAVDLHGKILASGRITFMPSSSGDPKLVAALTSGLNGLPYLQPAKIEGRAVEQKLVITIKFNSAVYSFSYRFLPINGN